MSRGMLILLLVICCLGFTNPYTRILEKPNSEWLLNLGDCKHIKPHTIITEHGSCMYIDCFESCVVDMAFCKYPLNEIKAECTAQKSLSDGPQLIATGRLEATEGDLITLDAVCINGQKDITGWMETSLKRTEYEDAGVHKVIVQCSNDKETIRKEIEIIINNKNRAPVIHKVQNVDTQY